MKVVTIFDTNAYLVHVHKPGCRDIARAVARLRDDQVAADLEADSIQAIVEDAFADFIFANDKQPWTDYAEYVQLAPCIVMQYEK